MLCKMVTGKRAWKLRETVASENTNPHKKTKYACVVEAHESTRKRLESTLLRNHEDHIAKNGSHASSDENSGSESCSEQRMEEARENPSVEFRENYEQNGCYS